MKIEREKHLFPPLKAHFKKNGYKVFAEVPFYSSSVDFVAYNGNESIAVEMKMSFNRELAYQGRSRRHFFDKVYVAYPVKKAVLFHADAAWKIRESVFERYSHCRADGIGILQVVGQHALIFEALEPKIMDKPLRIHNFDMYEEGDDDEAGLPCQKGVSAGYIELENVKKYVREHPDAAWKEIHANVPNHYEHAASMSGAMSQWRGFRLKDFKAEIRS